MVNIKAIVKTFRFVELFSILGTWQQALEKVQLTFIKMHQHLRIFYVIRLQGITLYGKVYIFYFLSNFETDPISKLFFNLSNCFNLETKVTFLLLNFKNIATKKLYFSFSRPRKFDQKKIRAPREKKIYGKCNYKDSWLSWAPISKVTFGQIASALRPLWYF